MTSPAQRSSNSKFHKLRSATRHALLRAAVWVLVPALAACGSFGASPPDSVTLPPIVHAAASDYVIGAGDHLQVFVYQSPTLSVGDTPVRPDGRISLPLVPDIAAAGKTPSQLSTEVASRLSEFVKNPNVSIIVHSFVSTYDRQIKVIGEASEPLALPYSDGMTVLDVMIQTKGLTKYAAGNRAIIVRRVGNTQQTIKVRLDDLLKNGDISQNVSMLPGDTLIIPQTFF